MEWVFSVVCIRWQGRFHNPLQGRVLPLGKKQALWTSHVPINFMHEEMDITGCVSPMKSGESLWLKVKQSFQKAMLLIKQYQQMVRQTALV